MAAGSRIDPRVALAMLLLVYIFNFLDRQILSILATPIKAELGLSDTQLGLLGGVAFAILYTVLSVPSALLADRTHRSRVIAGSLAIWSGFTALCGAATGFWHLFAARLGVGIAGLAFAPVFKSLVHDPRHKPRPKRDANAMAVFRILATKRSFWLISIGAGLNGMVSYALAFWLPSILIRSFDMTLTSASYFSGSLVLVGGSAGVLLGGWLADRSGRADPGYYPKLAGLSWLISAPLFVLGFLSPSASIAWIILLVPQALNLVWFGPVVTAVQHLVAPHMRATASACFLLIANLLGLGVGTWLMGALSDAMSSRYGAESLRYAAIAAVNLALAASALAFLSIRPLRREWVDAATQAEEAS